MGFELEKPPVKKPLRHRLVSRIIFSAVLLPFDTEKQKCPTGKNPVGQKKHFCGATHIDAQGAHLMRTIIRSAR